MNTRRISGTALSMIALGSLLWAGAGCGHKSPRSSMSVTETQAPVVARAARPLADSAEKRMQEDVAVMQDQIQALSARAGALDRFHASQMGPKWAEKVRAARAEASRPAERMRYLEATKALLARKLQSLRTEIKVYEEFESSDPTIPRP